MCQFIVNYANGTTRETSDDYFVHAYDSQLKALDIVSVDRWSTALEDYVEARRVP